MPAAYDDPYRVEFRRKKEERDAYVSSLQTYEPGAPSQGHGQRARLEGGRVPSGWRAVPEYYTRGSQVIERYEGGGKSPGEYTAEAMGLIPDAPDLQKYEKPTAVPLSPYMQQLVEYAGSLVSDPESPYRSLISGGPAERDIQTLINQGRRQFEHQTLPGIRDSFSGGIYGSGGQSGAALAAEAQARGEFGERTQQLRIAERQRADQNALQALGLLPQVASPLYQDMQLRVDNLNREIEVHYKNQNVDIAQHQQALQEVTAALDMASFNFNVDSYNEQMEMQKKMIEERKKASKRGLFGKVAGMVLGFALPGIGTAISAGLGTVAAGTAATFGTRMLGAQLGSSIGGMVGALAGGGDPSAYLAGGGGNFGTDMARTYYMAQMLGDFGNPGSDDGSGSGTTVVGSIPPYMSQAPEFSPAQSPWGIMDPLGTGGGAGIGSLPNPNYGYLNANIWPPTPATPNLSMNPYATAIAPRPVDITPWQGVFGDTSMTTTTTPSPLGLNTYWK